MAPKTAQQKVIDIYEAGSTKEDARRQLKEQGYSASRISQLLKVWPSAGSAPTATAASSEPPPEPLPSEAEGEADAAAAAVPSSIEPATAEVLPAMFASEASDDEPGGFASSSDDAGALDGPDDASEEDGGSSESEQFSESASSDGDSWRESELADAEADGAS